MTEVLNPESVRVAVPIYLDMVDAEIRHTDGDLPVCIITGDRDVVAFKLEHALRTLRALAT